MKFAYLIEPPFNYVDTSDHITGCDVEVARYVFSELGLGAFVPVEAEFADLLPGLADGRWRMTTGLFSTVERRSYACFSRPIWALPDGLLVRRGNPLALSGYMSCAQNKNVTIAVIRDQFQHRSAVKFGVPADRIMVFETYFEAAMAVRNGQADAYASVGRAHSGFINLHQTWNIDLVAVPPTEKPSEFGAFAFALNDTRFRDQVTEVLSSYLGGQAHRSMAKGFGFSESEIDLVVDVVL